MAIRLARPEEAKDIAALVITFYETEIDIFKEGYETAQVVELCKNLIDNHIVVVYEEEEAIVGTLVAALSPFLWIPDVLQATELAFYILPKYRGGTAAYRMIKKYEKEATASGCTYVNMAALATSPASAGKLYKTLGYSGAEKHYTKKVIIER